MSIIFTTKYFTVTTPSLKPHVSKFDGGHIVIEPNIPISDRTYLTQKQAHELIDLSIVCGKALKHVMEKQGILIGRINYQDNGNWTPTFHLHIYGRAINAVHQPFGHALNLPFPQTGFYDKNTPLTQKDIQKLSQYLHTYWKDKI